jgi:uncharacterized membrane protein YkvA (DUF1232 family)
MRTTTAGGRQATADELGGFQRARLSLRLLRDPRVATWAKLAVPAVALLYVAMPIDLIPDFILGLGQIDDLSVIGIAIFAMTKILPKLAPRDIVLEHLDEMRGRGGTGSAQTDERASTYDTTFRVVNDDSRGRSND